MTSSSLGDSALVLSLGELVDDPVLNRVRAVADAIRMAVLPGVLDVVPAFATVTVFYDIAHTGPYAVFEGRIREMAERAVDSITRGATARVIEIPVCYGGEYGPDLTDVADNARLTLDQVIERHSGTEYCVHAIGFVPGFAYLSGLPKVLHTPRRTTPRRAVPAGSVGVGGAQTGVYPVETPGGWNIIGRTPLVMFDAMRPEPALLHAADRVRFRAITPEELAAWK